MRPAHGILLTATILVATLGLTLHQPAGKPPIRSSEPLTHLAGGGCGCSEQKETSRYETKRADSPVSKGFRTWLLKQIAGRVPSPSGGFLQTDTKLAETALSPDGSAILSRASAGKVRVGFADQTRSAVIGFPTLQFEPKSSGRISALYGEFKIAGEPGSLLRLQLRAIRGADSTPIGKPVEVRFSRSQSQTVELEGQVEPAAKGAFGCDSPTFSVGVAIEPVAGARSVRVEVQSAGAGYVADPCCTGSSSGSTPTGRRAPTGSKTDTKPGTPCCDDASIAAQPHVASDGSITFDINPPAGADPSFQPIAEIVNYDQGDVNQIFPGVDTSTTGWLDHYPCQKAIGGLTQAQITQSTFGDPQLAAEGQDTAGVDQAGEYIQKVEDGLGARVTPEEIAKENRDMDTEDERMGRWMPDHPSDAPWGYQKQGPNPNQWAFYPGADIVYVHGLKLDHIKDLLGVPGDHEDWLQSAGLGDIRDRQEAVKVTWKTSHNLNGPASGDNPAYYSGYFHQGAEWYWKDGENGLNQGHIPVFLHGGGGDAFVSGKAGQSGYVNRYLVVSYSCADRLKDGAKAVLRQIADAMRFGTNVENPRDPRLIQGFGSRGLVIVSHSTGGLVTNVAMQLAKRRSRWNASWIVDHVKLHVAADSAMSGSRMASTAIAAACAADYASDYGLEEIGLPPMATKQAIAHILAACDLPIPVNNLTRPLRRSILLDLVPTVAQARWGIYFLGDYRFDRSHPKLYVPPTLLVPSAHPTQYAPVKYSYVQIGLDDGVVNMNSASGNPNPAHRWPSGFLGDPIANYDIGIRLSPLSTHVKIGFLTIGVSGNGLGQQKRANRYYLDMKDILYSGLSVANNPDKAILLGPLFFAAGPNYSLSPTGMLQSYGSGLDTYRHHVLERYPSMFVGISSAADHYDGTIGSDGGIHWPDYQETKNGSVYEANREETFAVGPNDGGIYQPYTPPAFRNTSQSAMLSRAVLNGPLPQHLLTRGLRVYFKIFHHIRSFWVVKRQYLVLDNWENQEKFDYVYWNALGAGR